MPKKPVVKGVKLPTAAFKRTQKKPIVPPGHVVGDQGAIIKKPSALPAIKSAAKGQTLEEADATLKAEAKKPLPKNADVPVESEKPGVARIPKPPKVHKPLVAEGKFATLEIISYHFLKLMERLAAEQGGPHAQALEDLKADVARRKP